MAAITYRHDVGVVRKKHWFAWIFWPLFIVAAIGMLYVADYTNAIDMPLMDEAYDRSEAAK